MGYGISARFGKAGPASGTQVLNPTEAVAGKSSTFYLAGGVGVLRNIIYFFLPLFIIAFRLKMQDGRLFRKSNFKKRRIPWKLVVKKYWV